MPDHKAGDTVLFTVGDKTLTVEPMPFGKLKKLIAIIADVSKKFDSKTLQEDLLSVVPAIVDGYVTDVIPLMFDTSKHPFLTQAWVDEHLTIPVTKDVVLATIAVNGLGDFFTKTVKVPAPTPVEALSGTTRTLSGSSGSTTFSASPTDGGPKT